MSQQSDSTAIKTSIGHSYESDYYGTHYGRIVQDPKYYDLISHYWKYGLFSRNNLDTSSRILDYGSGIGQVSAALPNVMLSDPSAFALEFAKSRGKTIITSLDKIPHDFFDIILSSHALEHSPNPADDLIRFKQYAKAPTGKLVLLIPSEYDMYRATKPTTIPRLTPDLHDQHFQCWTFQTITNLLAYCGWRAVHQEKIYGSFLLNALGKRFSTDTAVKLSYRLGRMKKHYPSLLTIADLKV
ncbi:MAG: methyltransferase domain-containing protein [Chthoniobacteraceae bacterium]